MASALGRQQVGRRTTDVTDRRWEWTLRRASIRPPSLWNGWRRGKLSNCRHVGVNAVHLVQKFLLNYITLTSSHEACCSLLLFLLYFTPPVALSISLSLLSYKCLNEPKTMTTISSLRRRVNEKSTADVFTKPLVDATWVSRDSSVCSTTISRRKKAGSKLYQCQRALGFN